MPSSVGAGVAYAVVLPVAFLAYAGAPAHLAALQSLFHFLQQLICVHCDSFDR
jgi:hypothetical protein